MEEMSDILEELAKRQEKIRRYDEERLQRLLQDPLVTSFLQEHDLNRDYLKDHLRIFDDASSSRKLCQNCRSLADCRQERAGERWQLQFAGGEAYTTLEYCPYALQKQKKQQEKKQLLYNDIPEDLQDLRFADLTFDADNKELILKLEKVLTGEEKKGYYLYGDFGTGKTYISIALCHEFLQQGKSCAFVKVNDFVARQRKLIIEDIEEQEKEIEALKRADVLFLDDIGNEGVSSFSRDDLLFTVLDYRMERKKLTFFTSNQDLNSLRQHYAYDKKLKEEKLKADRLLERIRILARPYCLGGRDRRG